MPGDTVRDHIVVVQLCNTNGLQCRDFVCGCTASLCVAGLMIQLSQTESIRKDASQETSCCYVEACYPCSVTNGCVGLGIMEMWPSQSNSLEANAFAVSEAAITSHYRTALKKKYNASPEELSSTFCEQYCGNCFCIPCHDAAVLRLLRPHDYGSFWCPSSISSQHALLL